MPSTFQPLIINSLGNEQPYVTLLEANTTTGGIATFNITTSSISYYRGSIAITPGLLSYMESESISNDMKTVTLHIKNALGLDVGNGTLVRAYIFGDQ